MLLSELLARLDDVCVENFRECRVRSVTQDSRCVSDGCVFVAREGTRTDGNLFAGDAAARGACAVVTEKVDLKKCSVTTIISKNATKTMAEIAKALYGDALLDMTIVGITGTKGKTSTLKILSECILSAGHYLVTVGTLGAEISASVCEHYDTENTTPDAPFIYKTLHRARSLGAKIAVVEVSSQALSELRVYGIPFTVCVFTNISHDHIGIHEHKSFEDYLLAKRSLFVDYKPRVAVVNSDDENWHRIADGCPRVIKVGAAGEYQYRHIAADAEHTAFSLCTETFSLSVGGAFNGMNAALALVTASEVLGCGIGDFAECLGNIRIPGRYELYRLRGIGIVIDFAHNGQSVAAIAESVRLHTHGRLILVFGSVGDRCHSRRAELARAAESAADLSVITSDNPGFESADAIAREIYSHFRDKSRAVIITDRAQAIRYAIDMAHDGDSVLLLGKGQESYQLTDKGRIYFSEREIIESLGASPVRHGKR